jgi:spore coat protein U-like protein
MLFGKYDPFSSFPLNSTGTVSIKCNDSGVSFRVKIDSGQNGSGFQPRQLLINSSLTGTETLDYNLYRDPAHTEIWGDGSPPTVIQEGVHNHGDKPTFTIYGRIPPGQNIPPGYYTDTLRVTVEW